MSKSELITWLASLPDDSPDLNRVEEIRRGAAPEEKGASFFSLKEVAKALGFKSYSTLHRLKVQRVGESWGGGRLKYRLSDVQAYLRSPDCAAVREELRRLRRGQPAHPPSGPCLRGRHCGTGKTRARRDSNSA